ncbi:serine-arginine protein 55 [Nasonia vitripennis]|uniref:DUF4797 domain-containing protein n=1 Tax=Nasonia vitripennis TaxID=7425 RepID=A0A7M7Q5Y0_NASVI|nr:serine-arginine protein 55 [Nasonia vitripennis]
MEETALLREPHQQVARSRSSQQVDLVDDECSTDSGCSSGGSTGSAEVLSRRGSAERHYHHQHSSAGGGGRSRGRSSSGQERLKQRKAAAAAGVLFKPKSSRSWSPEEQRTKFRPCHSILKSPSHSQSPSDTPSSDSDSLKRSSTARSLRKAFQSLKISTSPLSASEKSNNEKNGAKKCQKRILRSPVAYTYVKGLSGLPTQRIPRNAV